ncbi:MAG: hypothetical protein ACOX5W_02490 [Bacillota bacterium]
MRVPLTWLKEYVDIKISPEELARRPDHGWNHRREHRQIVSSGGSPGVGTDAE